MATQTRRATNVVQTGANWYNVADACDTNVDSSYAYRKTYSTSACHINGFNFNLPANAVVSKITISTKWYTSNSYGYITMWVRSTASEKYVNDSYHSIADGTKHTTPSYDSVDLSASMLQAYVNDNNIYNKNIVDYINQGFYLRFVGGSNGKYTSNTCEVRIYDIYVTVHYEASYSVSFNGNGATSGSVASLSANRDTSVTLPANGFSKKYAVIYNPNYNGSNIATAYSSATLKGWEDHGTLTAYDGVTYTYDKFDAPFYANNYADLFAAFSYNKQALLDHYVRYIVHGSETRSATGSPRGVYNQTNVVSNLADEGGSTTLYAQWSGMSAVTLITPSRDGYSFLGWYTAAEGGTKIGDGGASYTPTGNITLYAHWKLNEITDIYIGTSILDVYIGASKCDVYQGTTKIYG